MDTILLTIIYASILDMVNCNGIYDTRWKIYNNNQIYAPKGRGAEALTPIEAIAVFPGRGSVTLQQGTFPGEPVLIEISLNSLTPGDYLLQIHETGDISDYCTKSAGYKWYSLLNFNVGVLDNGMYWMVLKDYSLNLKENLNVIGKAISLRRKSKKGYTKIYGCEVIGLSKEEETLSWRSVGKRMRTFNPVPQYMMTA